MYVLECGDYTDITNWSTTVDGRSSFDIYDMTSFTQQVLPALFKAAKFDSFQRKLYRWGFVKTRKRVGDPVLSFSHPNFHRGNFATASRMTCSGPGSAANRLTSSCHFFLNRSSGTVVPQASSINVTTTNVDGNISISNHTASSDAPVPAAVTNIANSNLSSSPGTNMHDYNVMFQPTNSSLDGSRRGGYWSQGATIPTLSHTTTSEEDIMFVSTNNSMPLLPDATTARLMTTFSDTTSHVAPARGCEQYNTMSRGNENPRPQNLRQDPEHEAYLRRDGLSRHLDNTDRSFRHPSLNVGMHEDTLHATTTNLTPYLPRAAEHSEQFSGVRIAPLPADHRQHPLLRQQHEESFSNSAPVSVSNSIPFVRQEKIIQNALAALRFPLQCPEQEYDYREF
jgi:hypothetical protein